MSEAIISRRGYTAEGKPRFYTQMITGSTNWTVPKTKGPVSVRIFGGGAGPNRYGGGGWMNNADLDLNEGDVIQVTIGSAGYSSNSDSFQTGGTTSFGTFLSANGGIGRTGGAGGGGGTSSSGGHGYQFGGGGSYYSGGDGGVWGGGGGGGGGKASTNGGNGGMYGGGGGGSGSHTGERNAWSTMGGKGGEYGGGGGGGIVRYTYISAGSSGDDRYGVGGYGAMGGQGGTHGGNGGIGKSTQNVVYGENGTNTIGLDGVPDALQGNGSGGISPGGGKYTYYNKTYYAPAGGGGGGGYGGVGGNGGVMHPMNFYRGAGGGGGGGYGSKGGDSICDKQGGEWGVAGGGGGGYGGNGASTNLLQGGGGGGYMSDAIGEGGGGYIGKVTGSGGGGYGNCPGEGYGGCGQGGVCILQYYS